jgi:hypothetical protein
MAKGKIRELVEAFIASLDGMHLGVARRPRLGVRRRRDTVGVDAGELVRKLVQRLSQRLRSPYPRLDKSAGPLGNRPIGPMAGCGGAQERTSQPWHPVEAAQ